MIIGITGNSGSGKDTVSVIIKNNTNSLIINADNIAKENQKPNHEYYNKIVNLLGDKILNEDKKINRVLLAKTIFYNDEIREQINNLTFECIQKELDKILIENKDKDFIILNFPLLYEGNFDKICDYVIAVTADKNSKVQRIILRDKVTKTDAEQRISTQKSEDFYKENADFVIDNSGNVQYKDLINSTLSILKKIKEEK